MSKNQQYYRFSLWAQQKKSDIGKLANGLTDNWVDQLVKGNLFVSKTTY